MSTEIRSFPSSQVNNDGREVNIALVGPTEIDYGPSQTSLTQELESLLLGL